MSLVSGLESETDEWNGIQKLTTLQHHNDRVKAQRDLQEARASMRAELQRQHEEFTQRRNKYKQDQLDFGRLMEEKAQQDAQKE